MYKKIFLLLLLCLFAKNIFAKDNSITNTADIMIGISDFVSFQNFDGDLYENYENQFDFNSSMKFDLQVFLYKGLAIGSSFNINYLKYKVEYRFFEDSDLGIENVSDIYFQLGPSLHYYLNLQNKYIPFVGFTFLFSQRKYESNDIDVFTTDMYQYDFSIGFMYMLTKYFGIYLSYNFIVDQHYMHSVEGSGVFSDDLFKYLQENEEKEILGTRHKLSVGFKVSFDIL